MDRRCDYVLLTWEKFSRIRRALAALIWLLPPRDVSTAARTHPGFTRAHPNGCEGRASHHHERCANLVGNPRSTDVGWCRSRPDSRMLWRWSVHCFLPWLPDPVWRYPDGNHPQGRRSDGEHLLRRAEDGVTDKLGACACGEGGDQCLPQVPRGLRPRCDTPRRRVRHIQRTDAATGRDLEAWLVVVAWRIFCAIGGFRIRQMHAVVVGRDGA
jgi:hypothetical protein